MKKTRTLSLYKITMINLALCFAATFSFYSCDNELDLEQEMSYNEDLRMTASEENLDTWQKQIAFAKNNGKTKKDMNSIHLVDEKYLCVIKTESEKKHLIDRLTSEETVMAIPLTNGNYEITTLKQIAEKAKINDAYSYILDLKSILEDKIQLNMEVIELTWMYNGSLLNSLCIADNQNNGITYDPIGSFIICESSSVTRTTYPHHKIKTRSENESGGNGDQHFLYSERIPSLLGFTLAQIDIRCTSSFRNGKLNMISMDKSAYCDPIYDIISEIKTIEGSINNSNYHLFGWGYNMGLGNLTISINSVGVSMGGNTINSKSGIVTHR